MVTPFAGVWIEIRTAIFTHLWKESLPSRECGLKSCSLEAVEEWEKSLPSRECGLKFKYSALADACR